MLELLVAKELSKDLRCHISTVWKHKPKNVEMAKKATDVCPVCELLKKLRLKLAKIDADPGKMTNTEAERLFREKTADEPLPPNGDLVPR